jgi:hypothetical protein
MPSSYSDQLRETLARALYETQPLITFGQKRKWDWDELGRQVDRVGNDLEREMFRQQADLMLQRFAMHETPPALDPEPWVYGLLGGAREGFTPARSAQQETGGFVWDPRPQYAQEKAAYQEVEPRTSVAPETLRAALGAVRGHFAAHVDVAVADGNREREAGARELLSQAELVKTALHDARLI